MTAKQPDEEGVVWARQSLGEHFGETVVIDEVRRIASRLADLRRLTVTVETGTRNFYLKRYAPGTFGSWPDRLSHLAAVAAAVDDTPALLPYRIIAADAARELLLTAEVPGRPLATLHRPAIISKAARQAASEAWRGAGRWLSRVHGHAAPAVASTSKAADVVEDINALLAMWQDEDPARAPLARSARAGVADAFHQLAGRSVTMVLCHGDVTVGNIMVDGPAVGFVDFDDLRLDMPAVDLSQARLAIDEFGHVGLGGRRRSQARTAAWAAAFAAGYGRPMPLGPEFWLPHMRNLVVFLRVVLRQRVGLRPARLATELHYRRLLSELRTTLTDVRRGSESLRSGS